jgi:ABC-2 type transport system permease protein
MSIKKVLAVARWEFIEKVKTKAFLISLIITPVFMILMSVVPTLLMTKADTTTVKIGIIDETGEVAPVLNAELLDKFKLPDGKPNYDVVSFPSTEREQANKMVLQDQISSYIVIDSSIVHSRKFEYVSQNVSNFKEIERLQSAVKDIVVSNELRRSGVNPGLVKEISKPIDLETVRLSKAGTAERAEAGSGFALGYIFIIVLALFILTSGQLLVRSVVEEKSNRIVEVLLSSTTADEMMTGKILGLSLLGLTQLAVWAAIGIAFAGQLAAFLTIPDNIWWEVIFFVLGFLFYAAIFVMAGAPVTTEQEAQQATQYVSMLLFFPIIFAFLVIQNPTANYLKVLSLIPLLTPTMMAFRIPVQSPELWELILGALILIASIYFCMIAAGRIFRIGILVYGKRPNMKELIRWATKKN